jgi:hypothetical protein
MVRGLLKRVGARAGRAPFGRRAGRASQEPRAFTLIETAMATVIIGVGVVAMVDAQEAFTRSTLWSSHAATGTFLANELREMARHMSRHDPVTGLWIEGEDVNGWGAEAGETTITSFDDLDDLDGLTFGDGGDFAGPVNAYGELIPEIDDNGQPLLDEDDAPVSMTGWSQRITVEKVSPFDYSTALTQSFSEEPDGDWGGRAADEYPLRVTVQVFYQSFFDPEPVEVAHVSWVEPE